MSAGWLRAQLPRTMAQDPFLDGFVAIFEEIADTLRLDVDGVEHQLDTALASPAMLRYLAAWLGLDLDPHGVVEAQRELVHAIGGMLGWRGTRRGLEDLLQALTGSRVRVRDSGGCFRSSETLPRYDPTVVIELDHLGELNEAQVRAFVAAEVPVGTVVRIQVGSGRGGTGGGHATG